MSKFSKLSITGADNVIDTKILANMVKKYPFLELGVLFFLEKENAPRNPGSAWRKSFLNDIPKENTAVHLCGVEVFKQILSPEFKTSELFTELSCYARVQININARSDKFSVEDIHKVYKVLLGCEFTLIIQYHTRGESWVLPFLENVSEKEAKYINILLDASLGKGITPEKFEVPSSLIGLPYFIAFAGGINPDNIESVHNKIKQLNLNSYGLDLESGSRTDNEFDIEKANQLCERFVI